MVGDYNNLKLLKKLISNFLQGLSIHKIIKETNFKFIIESPCKKFEISFFNNFKFSRIHSFWIERLKHRPI